MLFYQTYIIFIHCKYLYRYRSAGREVIDVIKNHCNIIERASVDEAYLDITDIVYKKMSTNLNSLEYLMTQLSNTFVVGYSEIGKNDEGNSKLIIIFHSSKYIYM